MGVELKMAANGRIVLPADVRRSLGLEHGGTMRLELTDQAIVLRTSAQRLAYARALAAEMLKGVAGSAVDDLIADREAEVRQELKDERTQEDVRRAA